MINITKIEESDNQNPTAKPIIVSENESVDSKKKKTRPQTYKSIRGKGLFCDGERIGNYIEVKALIRTTESKEWSKRLEFEDMDGKTRIADIPCETLLKQQDTLSLLAGYGFPMTCQKKEVIDYLISQEPLMRKTLINRIGWINDKDFICPSFVLPCNEDSFSLATHIKNCGFAIKGTLKEWQDNICRYCENNKILTLSLCVGLSGVLLKILNRPCTIINLTGKSSIGKTTALQVAASLWGEPKNFIQQWRSTANALESVAEAHNDCVLILDELSQITGRDVGNIIYMLGNSKGKNRLNADSELKKTKEWSVSILSSGEIGIADKLAEAGEKAKAGQLVRCVDIDAQASDEFGIYDDLHEFENGADLSNHLKESCAKYHGAAAKEFVSGLLQEEIDIQKMYETAKQNLYQKYKLYNADGQVQRIADTFALYIVAGNLASSDCFGIFTHNSTSIEELISEVFKNWLTERGSAKSAEEKDVLEHVECFLQQHGARFRKIEIQKREDGSEYKGEEERAINNRLGNMEAHSDKTVWRIIPTLFRNEICKGMNYKTVRKSTEGKKYTADLRQRRGHEIFNGRTTVENYNFIL
jgi:putative DNA primase/helicase